MYSLKSNIQKDCFTQLVLFHNFAKTYTTRGPHESFWLTWYKGFHNYVYCTIYCSTRYMTFIDIKFNLQIAMRHHSKVNCNSISGSWENCFKFFQMQPFFSKFCPKCKTHCDLICAILNLHTTIMFHTIFKPCSWLICKKIL